MTIAIIGAVLAILAALAPALARWIKGRQDKAVDPETDRTNRINKAEHEIENSKPGPALDASAGGLADLDALERMQNKDRGGPKR